MSTYLSQFVSSVLLALVFILMGSLALILPWLNDLKLGIVAFIENSALTLSLFGAAFLILGSSLLAHQLLGLRRRPFVIKSGPHQTAICPKVLEKTLQAFCAEQFPTHSVWLHTQMQRELLSITIHLPKMNQANQKPFLIKLEEAFKELLARLFGYRRGFELIATFEE